MTPAVSLKLLTDAVVASYIHEISARHRAEEPAPESLRTGLSTGQRESAPGSD